ncbi:MAG: alpha/beta hydrolase [Reichenbachiella sp.]
MLAYKHDSGAVIAYECYGHGNKALIAFHGFGESPKHFQFLKDELKNYTIYSISLFQHGHSTRSVKARYLYTSEWKEIFSGLLSHLNINQFSLIAFSMGGRFAISTFHSFPKKVETMILIAPDGIVKRFWYEFATFPIGLRQLFHYLMSNPAPFFKVLTLLNHFKLINSSLVKFAKTQLDNSTHRMMVYNCWVDFKHFKVSPQDLAHTINSNQVNIRFIFGKKDRIIRASSHRSFFSKIDKPSLSILDHGHGNLVQQSKEIIVKTLDSTI